MDSSVPLLLLLLMCSSVMVEAGLTVKGLRASNLPTIPDAYVKVFYNTAYLGRTATINNNKNPSWNDQFSYSSASAGGSVTVEVYEDDVFSDDLLGSCKRGLKAGSYSESCGLSQGGTVYFSYTLN